MKFSNWLTSLKTAARRNRRNRVTTHQRSQMEQLENRTLLTALFVEGQAIGNSSSIQVEMADFNGDGFDDAFITNNRGDRGNRVLFGNGDGTFDDSGQALGNANSWGLAVGDIDGDGDVDAFVGNNGANRVYLNDGDGFFTESGQSVGSSYSVGTGIVDIDGDGDLDLFAANFGQANEVFLNDGSGGFTLNQSLASGSDGSVAFGDIDGDGDIDALTANDAGADFVWINDGSGNFSESGQRLGGGASIDVEVADIDGDGDLDAVTGDRRGGSNKVWLNDGAGVFSDSNQSLGSGVTWGVALGDIDLDGDVDAFFTNGGTGTAPNTIFVNDGNGVFTDSGLSLGDSSSIGVVLNDLNGDQRLDAFVANWSGRPDRVWLNDSDVVLNATPDAMDDSYSTDEDALLSPSAASAYTSAVLADDPLGYWRLGEYSGTTAVDSSGRGNDGTFSGAVTLGAGGAIADGDTSISLTSSSGHVNAGNPADLDISDDTLTIEAWVNPSSVTTMPIAGKTQSGRNDYTIWLVSSGGRNVAHFNLYNGSGEASFNGTIEVPVGEWTHIAGTYDGTTASIYINGVLDRTRSFSGNISGNDALNFEIGRRTNSGHQFRGQIDEVALYGDALSADRVLAHFEAASATGGSGGSVLDNDTDADGDSLTVTGLNGNTASIGQATVLVSGATVTLNADGTFQYDPTTSAAFNALNDGESTTDSFEYTIDDGNGEADSATVTITVNGVNDVASISGDNTGTMTEDGAGVTGLLTVSDVDNENVFHVQPGAANISPDGASGNPIQGSAGALIDGDTGLTSPGNSVGGFNTDDTPLTFTFDSPKTLDGIEVYNGWNSPDQAIAQFDLTFFDSLGNQIGSTQAVTVPGLHDATEFASFAIISNVSSIVMSNQTGVGSTWEFREIAFRQISGTDGTYGTFHMSDVGNWSYTRTADLQSLAAGESVSDSFVVASADGTASQTVTVTITGENDAPLVASDGNVSANEGQSATNSGTWSDVDASDVVTLSASVGSVTQNADGTWSWSFDTSDGPDDSQTVTITATDDDGAETQTGFDLTVSNVAPALTLKIKGGTVSVDEGETASVGVFVSDPGNDTVTLAASVGTITQDSKGNFAWSFDTSDGPDESQTVTITATDSDGATTLREFDLAVNNVAPSVTVDEATVTVDEGQTATMSGTWSDAGNDVVTVASSIGTVTTNTDGTWDWSYFAADGPNTIPITITATDSDGATSGGSGGSGSAGEAAGSAKGTKSTRPAGGAASTTQDDNPTEFALIINNVAPSVDNAGDVSVDEGRTATNSGTWSDPGDDVVTLAASVGSVTQNADGTWSWSFDTSDGPEGSRTVTITATDDDGAETQSSFELTVDNVAPALKVRHTLSVDEGDTATTSGIWSDPGDDTVTLAASVGNIVQNADGTFTWSFDTSDGPEDSQTVAITATDSDGATTVRNINLTVNNVAPSITANAATVTVDEGQTATMSGIWSDPGNDVVTVAASIGTVTTNADGTWDWSYFAADGRTKIPVTITATDGDPATDGGAGGAAGARTKTATSSAGTATAAKTAKPAAGAASTTTTSTSTAGFVLIVNNVAPSVDNAGDVSVDEGRTATNSGTWSDPGDDVVTLAASVGSVTQNADGTWSWSFDTSDGPEDSRTVTIAATDDDGAETQTSFDLIVENVAPALNRVRPPRAVDEGETVSTTGLWSDAGNDTVTLNATIGTVTQNADGTFDWSLDTSDGPDDSQTVTITATDSDGASSDVSFPITVNNVAPSVASDESLIEVDEGQTATNIGSWSDPGADVVTVSASVGTVTTNPDGTWNWSFDTVDGREKINVILTATDSDGATSQSSFVTIVNNVAPSVTNNGNSTVDEGAIATNSGTWSDPGDDVVTLAASVGAITQNADGTWSWSFDTSDGPDDSQIVTITATDDDGAATQSSFDLTVNNVAPSVTSSGNVTLDEGATAMNSGTWDDPGDDVVVVSASIGTVTQNADGTWSWSFDTSDGPDDSQTVTITASDDDGGETQTSFELSVNNVAPTVVSVSSTNADVENASDDGSVSISGSFLDPGLDTHVVTVNWGDGTSEEISVDQSADSFTGEHDYANGGIFTVTVTVTDSDGAASTIETVSAVVKGAGLVDGTLFVIGTDGKDVIHVHEHWRRDRITVHAHLDIQHRGRWHRRSTSTHVHETYAVADVDQIVVHALASNDHVHVGGYFFGDTAKDAVIFGGDGNDHIVSSQGNDTIDGGAGSDFISSRGGNDVIVDMAGDNYVHAGDGDDVVTTGNGNDCIHGGSGNDQINAGDGHNWASGGAGNDIIVAGIGNDRLNGDLNNDLIVGGGGNDRIDGGRGRDVLIGGTGSDRVNGGNNGDLLIGGSAENASDMASLDAALSAWADGDLSAALLNLGTISDDAARDILKGGRGTDERIGGAGDKLKR